MSKTLTITMQDDVYGIIESLAEEDKRSKSFIINECVEIGLTKSMCFRCKKCKEMFFINKLGLTTAYGSQVCEKCAPEVRKELE